MVQVSRPDNDDAIGVWLDEGGGTPLFDSIDEVTPSDTDFIESDNSPAVGETCEIGMSPITDPAVSSGYNLRWRYAKSASGGRNIEIRLALREGTTVIVERIFTLISNSFVQDNYLLSAGEADNISDHGNLNVRCIAIRSGGGAGRRGLISWVELEVPDAPASNAQFINMQDGDGL